MIRVKLSELEKLASVRADGLMEDWLEQGSIAGNSLWLEDSDYRMLIERYKPGIGDCIARFLKPLVKGTRLENCGGCYNRQGALNAIVPMKLARH